MISVIIPAHNEESAILQTLEHLRTTTFIAFRGVAPYNQSAPQPDQAHA